MYNPNHERSPDGSDKLGRPVKGSLNMQLLTSVRRASLSGKIRVAKEIGNPGAFGDLCSKRLFVGRSS
jgi:hypothetical protein